MRNVDEKDWPQYLIVDDSWQRFQPNITLLGRNGNIILNVGRSSDKEGPGFGPFVSIDNHPVNNLKGAEEEMVELSLKWW